MLVLVSFAARATESVVAAGATADAGVAGSSPAPPVESRPEQLDGGASPVLDVERASVLTTDGERFDLIGGCYLPDARCWQYGRLLVGDDAEKKDLRKAVLERPMPWQLVLVGVGAAVLAGALGFGIGYGVAAARAQPVK